MRPDRSKTSPEVNRLLTYDVGAVAKMMEEKFPETWRRINTRSVQSPSTHWGHKIVPVGLVGAIEEARAAVGNLYESNVGLIAGILEDFDFPTYYVSGPLMEALKRSHPPEGLTWADLTLPFPACCFMVPRGSLVEPEPTRGQIACVGYAWFPANVELSIPTLGKRHQPLPESRISVFWILGPSGVEVQDSTFPEHHALEPSAEWIDEKSVDRNFVGPAGEYASWVAGLVANFVLVMEARKELVEPGERIFKSPREGRPDVYSPTFIGRNYQILRKESAEKSDRKAQFTELGWRAGHFKRQRFGARREQTKTIFVDPYVAFTRGLEPLERKASE